MTVDAIASQALERLAGSPVLILGPFLLTPDGFERLEVYRALNVPRGAEMRAVDRLVVRGIFERNASRPAVAAVAVA